MYKEKLIQNVPDFLKDSPRWIPLDGNKKPLIDEEKQLWSFNQAIQQIGKMIDGKKIEWLGFVTGDGWGCYEYDNIMNCHNIYHFKEPHYFEWKDNQTHHVIAQFSEDIDEGKKASELLINRWVHCITGVPDTEETYTEEIDGLTVHTVPAAEESAEEKKLIITGFDDVEIKPTDYLFFPWFPRGKLVMVQGDTSSSKSTFMYAVGAKVSTGADLLSVPCEDPGNVMFLTIEDDESDIKTAFQDAGGDVKHLRRIQDREQIAKLSLSEDGARTIDEIIKRENLKLLVLDPIQQFIMGDMNKANDTRQQLTKLMNIAAENNICIVFLAHMGKDTSKAALHRSIGSVDIGAATRSIIQIVTDPTDDYFKIAFSVKNNTAAFHDVQRAIRYQVKDHPDSYDPATKQRARFHGHAEFSEIMPEYNERLYRKAQRKADEASENEETLQYEYDDDPLVITARALIAENPHGIFIGTDDLIQRITQCAGHCPYIQGKSNINGIYSRVNKLRSMMIEQDGIQADVQSNSKRPQAYNWNGSIYEPDGKTTKGIYLYPVKNGSQGYQQTKI